MIAGCIEKLRHDSCGSCERRDACSFLWTDLLGFGADDRSRRSVRPDRAALRNPFLAFLGEVAKTIEGRTNARQAARSAVSTPAPPPAGSFRREVEGRIEISLPLGEIRIDSVARALGVSRKTLYRRLKAEGATFEQLLDRLRHRLAWRYLTEHRMAVKEAAWRLGFSDPAAFSRAFKRWTGLSPAAARGSTVS